MSEETIDVVLVIAVFQGEHMILVADERSDDPFPENYVGLPATRLQADDTEKSAIDRALACFGSSAKFLSPHFVDRVFEPELAMLASATLFLVYTCDMYGYHGAIAVKPDKLPANFFPLQRNIPTKVIELRRKKWN